MKKISFILPIYNVAPYLQQCFDSIHPFLIKGHQMILVNNGEGSLFNKWGVSSQKMAID